ncbi:MAG: four helix bundle protein [Paludibacteraceae bacterium]|nr:four helix bundle protein [Paludibacteraceae bacterium]
MSRTSNKEKVHFLDIAYASMLEMDSQLDISKDLGFISEEQYKDIHNMVCTIGRQLNGLRQWAQPHSNTSAKPT